MEPNDCFVIKSEDIASEEFDGEFVVLDLQSGKYFSLLGDSSIVWRGLLSGHSAQTLCAEIPPDDPRRADVASLIESLVAHELIAVASQPVPEPPKAVAVELASASGPFVVDMFDDLSDLMLADPIHDVDPRTGWPVLLTKQD
jgi:hypothetical protein